MENVIYNILNDMTEILNIQQMRILQEVLIKRLQEGIEQEKKVLNNQEYLDMFVAAKKIEGCSERTIEYYKVTISNMFKDMNIPIR